MSQDRNPYYDSARDKPDRSEFASLRMDIQDRRAPRANRAGRAVWVNALLLVGLLIVVAVAAKRFLLT